jgi:hypothetical protein
VGDAAGAGRFGGQLANGRQCVVDPVATFAGLQDPVLATFLIRAKNWVINLTLGSFN